MADKEDDWLDHDSCEERSQHDDMEREWNARRREFHVSGMRDGYEVGKEETVQEGFDHGFVLGARSGFVWGCTIGAAGTYLASMQNARDSGGVDTRILESVVDIDHQDVKKQACGSLWEEHGEMKDRFPEHQGASVQARAKAHDDIRKDAVALLPQIHSILDAIS